LTKVATIHIASKVYVMSHFRTDLRLICAAIDNTPKGQTKYSLRTNKSIADDKE
jgi:hypothetical protein